MTCEEHFKVRAEAARLAVRAAFLLALLACVAATAAAQAKPNIAGDVREPGRKPKPDAPSGAKRPAPATRTQRRSAYPPPPQPQPRPPALLDVTFVTGIAESDIFVNAPDGQLQSLGKTGADGKLGARMPHGVYNVTASRAGYNAQRQQINVQPGSTNFILNLSGQPLPGTLSLAAEVLRRFSDPKQTDRVTITEWQAAQQQTAVAFAANPLDSQIRAHSLFAQGQVAYLRGDYASALVAFNNAALALPPSPRP
jgi:hypothetical protein